MVIFHPAGHIPASGEAHPAIMRVLLLLIFSPALAYSQSNYIPVPDHPDQKTITMLQAGSDNASVKSLVYQPSSGNELATSCLFIQTGNKTQYWLIKDDSIIKNGIVHKGEIFSFKNYLKTGATSAEDKLKFVPPLLNGVETVNVIYEDDKRKFYFQYGKNVTGYEPDERAEKYRKEWVELIRKALQINGIISN